MAVRTQQPTYLLIVVFNRETSSHGSDDLPLDGQPATITPVPARWVASRVSAGELSGRVLAVVAIKKMGGGVDDRAAPSPVAAADRSQKQIGNATSSRAGRARGGRVRGARTLPCRASSSTTAFFVED